MLGKCECTVWFTHFQRLRNTFDPSINLQHPLYNHCLGCYSPSFGVPVWAAQVRVCPVASQCGAVSTKFFQWCSSVPRENLLGRPVVSQCTQGQPVAFQCTLAQGKWGWGRGLGEAGGRADKALFNALTSANLLGWFKKNGDIYEFHYRDAALLDMFVMRNGSLDEPICFGISGLVFRIEAVKYDKNVALNIAIAGSPFCLIQDIFGRFFFCIFWFRTLVTPVCDPMSTVFSGHFQSLQDI